MATKDKEISFTFIMPPNPLVIDPEDEETFPEIKVNTGGLETALQAILLRILPCLTFESKNGGADHMFRVDA